MATIYDHIAKNKQRIWLLVLLFPAVFAFLMGGTALLISHMYGGTTTDGQQIATAVFYCIPILWGLGLIWMLVSYFFGDQMILSGAGAVRIYKEDQPEIYRLVENLCVTKGLPTPKIYILDDMALNAFATGRDPEHASIALTLGIVNELERTELEGVIAHELAHIENRDIRLMLFIIAGITFCTFMGQIMFRSAFMGSNSRRKNKDGGAGFLLLFIVGSVLLVYGYIMAPLLRLSLSRSQEYQADATAALTTRNPRALASALKKISENSRVKKLEENEKMVALCIANPIPKLNMSMIGSLSGLFATHPPIEKRIEALLEMDGQKGDEGWDKDWDLI